MNKTYKYKSNRYNDIDISNVQAKRKGMMSPQFYSKPISPACKETTDHKLKQTISKHTINKQKMRSRRQKNVNLSMGNQDNEAFRNFLNQNYHYCQL